MARAMGRTGDCCDRRWCAAPSPSPTLLRTAPGQTPDSLKAANIWGFPKNGRPFCSTINSRILIIRTPKLRYPNFRKVPYSPWHCQAHQQQCYNSQEHVSPSPLTADIAVIVVVVAVLLLLLMVLGHKMLQSFQCRTARIHNKVKSSVCGTVV